jgi:rhodanese-related sulfurtransferase
MASHGAAREAVKLGFENSYVMGAGIEGWVKAGKPVEKGDAGKKS